MDEAEKAVMELYDFRDRYFERHDVSKASEKPKLVKERMSVTLQKLDEVSDTGLAVKGRARLLYLKGHAHNILTEFDAKCEEFLSRAVKLDPTLVEAWNSLGECYWKQGNIEGAFNCFNGALGQAQSKVTLRNLSMILRQMGKDAAEKLKNVSISVEKAKAAVSFDVSDGLSWYVLGNAYLSLFFISGHSAALMKQCMTAYAQAEKDPLASNNPDLHYNRAVAYQYEENYELAFRDFTRAVAFDPSWTEPQEYADKLAAHLIKVRDMVTNKGRLKPKKLASLQQSLSERDLGPYSGGKYASVTGQSVVLQQVLFDELKEGINRETIVVGKVVGVITAADSITSQYDFCVCLSVCLSLSLPD
jgi:tetratricopeptide (TPR) repeat protein